MKMMLDRPRPKLHLTAVNSKGGSGGTIEHATEDKLIRVGITGASGLLGWHCRAFFHARKGFAVSCATRETFADPRKLEAFVSDVDVLVHFAAVIRGEPEKIYSENNQIAEQLIDACRTAKAKPHMIFSSSTQIYSDTPYGNSKRRCSEFLADAIVTMGGRFTNLILPHVFGELGKPFYNSVVSTFCHQLAAGEDPRIINDTNLALLHAQRVCDLILIQIESKRSDWLATVEAPGTNIKVSELLAKLRAMRSFYEHQVVPNVEDPLDLELFNTFRSYLFPRMYPVTPVLRQDARGRLFEAVKSENGGQTFISTTKPGCTRGNHYHFRKHERFCVLSGEGLVRIRKLFDCKVHEFHLRGETPQWVDIPTLHTHSITGAGTGELVTLFWSNEIFDPENPDTYPEMVG